MGTSSGGGKEDHERPSPKPHSTSAKYRRPSSLVSCQRSVFESVKHFSFVILPSLYCIIFIILSSVCAVLCTSHQDINDEYNLEGSHPSIGGADRIHLSETLKVVANDRQKRDGSFNSGSFNTLQKVNYCSWDRPLNTKYLLSFYEAHRTVNGCSSAEQTADNVRVHAVRINTTQARIVLLTVSDNDRNSSGLVVLLDSSKPVKWRLTFTGVSSGAANSYMRKVYVSKGSEIYYSNVKLDNSEQPNLRGRGSVFDMEEVFGEKDDFSAAQLLRKHWGAISSFSRISDANRISISLPQTNSLPPHCTIEKDATITVPTATSSASTNSAALSAVLGTLSFNNYIR